MKKEKRTLILFILIFLAAYFLPFSKWRVQNALLEAFLLLQEYAREHVLFCLIPAFFIAGAISVFIRQAAVVKYFGPRAKKVLSYSVASVSGTILAVCSCTVLPIFAGIYSRGAGIGPAATFLYAGPAINVLAIILTAKVLGFELGLARAIGAISFSIFIGILMHFLFKGGDKKAGTAEFEPHSQEDSRPLWKTALYFATLVAILVVINWARPEQASGVWAFIYKMKWYSAGGLGCLLAWMLASWFKKEEIREWALSTWVFAKQIFPLLVAGVLLAGFLLGRPNQEGLIPSPWVADLVGGNSLASNVVAALSGALMYFATLTEVPILEGLLGSGMGQGPALALLLAGPAVSLPSLLVIRSVIGTKKTVTYVVLVVIMATISGFIYGSLFG